MPAASATVVVHSRGARITTNVAPGSVTHVGGCGELGSAVAPQQTARSAHEACDTGGATALDEQRELEVYQDDFESESESDEEPEPEVAAQHESDRSSMCGLPPIDAMPMLPLLGTTLDAAAGHGGASLAQRQALAATHMLDAHASGAHHTLGETQHSGPRCVMSSSAGARLNSCARVVPRPPPLKARAGQAGDGGPPRRARVRHIAGLPRDTRARGRRRPALHLRARRWRADAASRELRRANSVRGRAARASRHRRR